MKSWKTTLFGLITAAASFVLFSPDYFPPVVVDLSRFVMAGGLMGMGIYAKDWNATGPGTGVPLDTKTTVTVTDQVSGRPTASQTTETKTVVGTAEPKVDLGKESMVIRP